MAKKPKYNKYRIGIVDADSEEYINKVVDVVTSIIPEDRMCTLGLSSDMQLPQFEILATKKEWRMISFKICADKYYLV